MRLLTGCIIILVIILVLMTGCTSQSKTGVTTIAPTKAPVIEGTQVPVTSGSTVIPETVTATVSDPALYGTWYLKLMSEQNGTALVQTLNPEINLIFNEKSGIDGFSGCNDYSGIYTLTGKNTPYGKEISITDFNASNKICNDVNSEKNYLEILKGTTSYLVNVNQELTFTDNMGNSLVYQRTPYSETSVPKGV